MYPTLYSDETDDPGFMELVKTLVHWVVTERAPHEFYVIGIKNWFDHKWLGFSGKGLVPFDGGALWAPDVALDAVHQDQITFPPFTPKRVRQSGGWCLTEGEYVFLKQVEYSPVHPRVLESSNWNLNRRVADRAPNAVYFWFSSNTKSNQRGAVMSYSAQGGELDSWYASFTFRAETWRLDASKGIRAEVVSRYLTTPIHF